MKFVFDTNKSIAAAAYLSQKFGESLTVLFLIKMLYAADRDALVAWHRTITGDTPVSMDNGPVLTRIYDLTKGRANGPDMVAWDRIFQRETGRTIKLHPNVDVESLLDFLSDRELETLDRAYKRVRAVQGRLSDWAHTAFPEWKNPNSSSLPIDFAEILSLEGFSGAQIKEIEAEVDSSQSAKRALKAA